MARSRYFQTPVVQNSVVSEPAHYATWSVPLELQGDKVIDYIKTQNYVEHVWEFGDRLDRLANKYYQDDQYWWLIALANNIPYPLGIKVGTILRIPLTIDPILEMLELI